MYIYELPSAYKNADSVVEDMAKFNLADIVERVMPYGSIMAGDWQRDVQARIKVCEAKRLSDITNLYREVDLSLLFCNTGSASLVYLLRL